MSRQNSEVKFTNSWASSREKTKKGENQQGYKVNVFSLFKFTSKTILELPLRTQKDPKLRQNKSNT